MTNKSYFFKLTPVGKFFFGNEKTFGQGEEANYLVRSNVFPQQTSILGMLRLALLKNGENTFPINDANRGEVKKRIGEAGFSHTAKNQSFGIIEKLSPVFVCNKTDNIYYPAPSNQSFSERREFEGAAYRLNSMGEFRPFLLPVFPGFDHKKSIKPLFQNLAGQCLEYSEVFMERSQVGIQKTSNGEENDQSGKGFYRQFFYTMKKGFSFCFWGSFKEEVDWKSPIVFLGADKSSFKLEVSEAEWEKDFEQKFTSKGIDGSPILLLSDAWVTDGFYEQCEFVISETTDFRYIKTTIDQTDYSHSKRPEKSEVKLLLLKKGTVIYPGNNTADLQKQLDNPTFKTIGYNVYKTI